MSAAALWGSSYPAISIAVREAGPLSIALVRGVAQSLMVAVALLLIRPSLSRFGWRWFLAVCAVGLLGGFFNVGQSLGVALAGAAIGGFVAGLYPLVAAATAPLVAGDSIGRGTWMALGICAIGVGLIAFPADMADGELGGILWAAASALAFGVFLPASRRIMNVAAFPPLAITLSVFLGLSLEAIAGIVLVGDASVPEHPSVSFVLAITWLILGAGVAPLVLVEVALKFTPTGDVAPYLFLAPVVSAVLSIALLGEVLSGPQLLGGGLVVAGLVVQTVAGTSGLRLSTPGET